MPQWKDLARETKVTVIKSLAVHNDGEEQPYPSSSLFSTLAPITLVNRELSEVAGRHLWEKVTVDQSARKGFSVRSRKAKDEKFKKDLPFTEVVLPTRGAHVRLVDCRSEKESSTDHLDRCVEVINGCSGVTELHFESENNALAVAKRLNPSTLKTITALHLVDAGSDSAELFPLFPSLKTIVVATDELGDSSESLVPVIQAIPTLESFKSRGYDDFNSPTLADEWKGPIRSLYLDSHMDLATIISLATRLSPTLQEFSVARLPNDKHRSIPPDLDLPHLHTLLLTIDWQRLTLLGLFVESPLRTLTIAFFGDGKDKENFVEALLPIVRYLRETLRTLRLIFVDSDPEDEMLEGLHARCEELGVVLSVGDFDSMDGDDRPW